MAVVHPSLICQVFGRVGYNIGIHIMVILNSMKCHLHDFIRLGNEVGLWFERVGDLGNINYWGIGLTAGLSCKIKQLTIGQEVCTGKFQHMGWGGGGGGLGCHIQIKKNILSFSSHVY